MEHEHNGRDCFTASGYTAGKAGIHFDRLHAVHPAPVCGDKDLILLIGEVEHGHRPIRQPPIVARPDVPAVQSLPESTVDAHPDGLWIMWKDEHIMAVC